MSVVAVIPARWASTRLPGKPLIDLCGKPMIQRVFERVSQASGLDHVLVATDDERILDVVASFGGHAVMTAVDHPTGTDRIAEAVGSTDANVVINVQGDEPFIDIGTIEALCACMRDPEWDMATAATRFTDVAQVQDPSAVKVVFDAEGRALYFSRSVIPHLRDVGDVATYWRHVGIYAYRTTFLRKLVQAPQCSTEKAEKLEQLRALHMGARIKVLAVEELGIGIDTPEDVEYAVAHILSGRNNG